MTQLFPTLAHPNI